MSRMQERLFERVLYVHVPCSSFHSVQRRGVKRTQNEQTVYESLCLFVCVLESLTQRVKLGVIR